MSPWQAALIPLAIIAVFGSIAFFIGYRGLFSNDRPDDRADDGQDDIGVTTRPTAPPTTASTAASDESVSLSPAEAAARRDELRAKVAVSDRLIVRAPREQAVVMQFIDLSAPGTAQIHAFLTDLRRNFAEHLTFAARHLPTSDGARLGAAALESAERQGRFLPFLDHLIATTDTDAASGKTVRNLDEVDDYVQVARELGLDVDEFTRTMTSAAVSDAIDADRAEANRAGIIRAPSLVLLDEQDNNALSSLEEFRRAVEAALDR